MLKIRIITNADLEVVPVGVKAASPTEMKILQLYALVIAGLDGSREEDSDSEETNQENSGLEKSRKWKDFYNDYKNKISAMKLWQCQKISVQYKEDQDICQKLKKFHHDTDSAEFYYVESLYDRNVFQYFVDSFIEYLGTGTDQIIVSTVMNSREDAIEYAKKDNDLMCDEEFKAELGKLGDLTEDEKAELKGNKADDDGAIKEGARPSFTAEPQEDKSESQNGEGGQTDDNGNTSGTTEGGESDGRTFLNGQWVHVREHTRSYPNRGYGGSSTSAENYVDPAASGETSGNSSDPDDGSSGNGPSEDETPVHDDDFCGAAATMTAGSNGTGSGSRRSSGERHAPRRPKPFSEDDVDNFGSKAQTRTLNVLEPTETEVEAINSILGEGLSPEQIADQNYLVQLRLYNFLNANNMAPEESRSDFVRNGSRRREQSLHGGKYIHKCSAAGGIMYISPAIWNKLASGRCIVLVYYGAKANSFMYFRTIDDILKWIREDDIVIKLTGEEKADAVNALYSGVLNGVKGTAYTLIRVKSNAKYNSLFAPLAQDPTEEHQENEGDYY